VDQVKRPPLPPFSTSIILAFAPPSRDTSTLLQALFAWTAPHKAIGFRERTSVYHRKNSLCVHRITRSTAIFNQLTTHIIEKCQFECLFSCYCPSPNANPSWFAFSGTLQSCVVLHKRLIFTRAGGNHGVGKDALTRIA
jgi:hypothetical protein